MKYYKIGLDNINGVNEYYDIDAVTEWKTVNWLNTYLTNKGWDFSDLVDKKVYVDQFNSGLGKRKVMDINISVADFGMIKIDTTTSWGSKSSWAHDPKTGQRTEWGNDVHEDWIAEDVEKDLQDKIRRLERLNK
jgi:hypothetical protein